MTCYLCVFFRCRHGAIAKFFGDDKPKCNKSCDFCLNPEEVLQQSDNLKRGVYANSHAKRHLGRTAIMDFSDEPDDSLYGGGRMGAKA